MNEKIKAYEEKMQKTMDNLGRGARSNPCRTCQSECSEQDYGRLLWNTNTNPAGCKRICSGTEIDPDPAMGEDDDQRDRESDHDF